MLTNDARAGIDDIDDLDFVESMTIYVRSLDESSGLKEVAIAWFYREESPDSTPSQLVFESDPELNLKAYVDGGFELFSKGVSRKSEPLSNEYKESISWISMNLLMHLTKPCPQLLIF